MSDSEYSWTDFYAFVEKKTGISLREEAKQIQVKAFISSTKVFRAGGLHAYKSLLEQSSVTANHEWGRLLEIFNISESYFFRDDGHFQLLRNAILPKIIESKSPGETVRVWSAGSSQGQEAYSLSIVLYELLIMHPEIGYSIFGSDINRESLAIAEAGVYSKWSLRQVKEDQTKKYFHVEKDSFRIKDQYKKNVQFMEFNLLGESYPMNFDLIICRNVFIYFEKETVSNVVKKFAHSLNESGFFLSGHAELPDNLPRELHPTNSEFGVYYQKDSKFLEPKVESFSKSSTVVSSTNRSLKPVERAEKLSKEECIKKAESFEQIGSHKDAIKYYQLALDQDSEDPYLYLSLATQHEAMGHSMQGMMFREDGMEKVKKILSGPDISKWGGRDIVTSLFNLLENQ